MDDVAGDGSTQAGIPPELDALQASHSVARDGQKHCRDNRDDRDFGHVGFSSWWYSLILHVGNGGGGPLADPSC
jgi:hypothetical protein